MNGLLTHLFVGGSLLFAALPATSNYKLNSYDFGSGGTANSRTATYGLEGNAGGFSGARSSTANTTTRPGYVETQQANTPKLASVDNGSGQYYNKLHFVIDSQGNSSDAKYLVAVSPDGFTTTYYLQPDGTLSTTLATSDYQTYSAWGGASGSLIIGLQPSTSYSIKLKATQGTYTESMYGPVFTPLPSTAAPSLTFSLTTSAQSTPPFSVGFASLVSGTVTTAGQTINTGFTTNGASGGSIYLRGQNGGLTSPTVTTTVPALSGDLTGSSRGYGGQSNSATQTSGGPFSAVSPYNGTSNTVGIIDTSLRSLYTTAAPVTSGSGVLQLKAKVAATDPAATDYGDILTLVAAANF